MSRATVRAAVASFLAPPAVDGLTTVYASMPRKILDRSFADLPGQASGTVGVVMLPEQAEERRALGGANHGGKMITHDVELRLFFRSKYAAQPDQPGDDALVSGMADYDAVVEAILERLRSDRNLGQPSSVIFQSGEGPGNGFKVRTGEPEVVNNILVLWGMVAWRIQEWIDA